MPEPRRCLAFLSRSSACRSSLPGPLGSKRSNDHENADLLPLSSVWVSRPLGSSCPFCCSSSWLSPFAACSSLCLQVCWSPDEVGLKSSGRLANVSSSRRPTRLLYILFISLRNSWAAAREDELFLLTIAQQMLVDELHPVIGVDAPQWKGQPRSRSHNACPNDLLPAIAQCHTFCPARRHIGQRQTVQILSLGTLTTMDH